MCILVSLAVSMCPDSSVIQYKNFNINKYCFLNPIPIPFPQEFLNKPEIVWMKK